ncbi:hemerythrin domain-containing protein [Flavobacterium sp. LHD-85]|uniref:hemerythrin domain-containing protein n=1 Tax=Flavobacterium sp. LHD-85 TaxID=3071410 RepID=UPI0027DF43AD|nr:hemerythrin domain-containing protein [Flavobacterium sp. LHD-85]MDQ6532146.1 hemerythrin domain-containing protein [Flavobacterium sp. LHD-85]
MNSNKAAINKENKINLEKLLSSLHRDHQQSLELCWVIREGIRQNVDSERIKKYANWYYINELEPHFEIEKEYIFPILGMENEMVKKVLTQHRRLKKHFTKEIEVEKALSRIEEELEVLIRYEEKNIFQAIKKNISSFEISLNDSFLEKQDHQEWNDVFWQ